MWAKGCGGVAVAVGGRRARPPPAPAGAAAQGGFDFLGMVAALLVGAIALLITNKLSGGESDGAGR